MALLTFPPESSKPNTRLQKSKPKKKHKKIPSSWDQIKNLITCKLIESPRIQNPSKLGSSCRSICSFKDVVHGNTRVIHRADNSPESSNSASRRHHESRLLTRKGATESSASSSSSTRHLTSRSIGYSRGMQFRKLSGCYECRMIVDPAMFPSTRTTVCVCSQCGEVFPKSESLEIHQAVRHAVSELGMDDSGRNIVEIIFKSSWLKKDNPICKIERILKVHNTQRTIQRFEDCREAVKTRALTSTRKNARCAADGNELLRFHCTTLTCALGARGSTTLCGSGVGVGGGGGCGVCTIIRHGFQDTVSGGDSNGVRTTASSGRAHDSLGCTDGRRAMLVCRVIAGRIKRVADSTSETSAASAAEDGVFSGFYDSVADCAGIYSNLEELIVFNPRAILPCFVVIYKDS